MEIMKVNIGALLSRAKDPEKTIDEYMRSLNLDLRQVKGEAASVLAEERRVKRVLDECLAEASKLQRYAEKAAASGNDAEALKFLDKKAALSEKQEKLQAAYELAASNTAHMKQIEEKLTADLKQLEERHVELKQKIKATQAQQKINAMGSASGSSDMFHELEEKVDKAYLEAMAIAELRKKPEDDLDELIAQLEQEDEQAVPESAAAESELAKIKDKLKHKKD